MIEQLVCLYCCKCISPGTQILAPAHCRALLTAGDKIIVLAEDDDTYSPAEPGDHAVQMCCPEWRPKKRVERILFLGWRRDMHDLISVLDKFVDPGSELWLYNEV